MRPFTHSLGGCQTSLACHINLPWVTKSGWHSGCQTKPDGQGGLSEQQKNLQPDDAMQQDALLSSVFCCCLFCPEKLSLHFLSLFFRKFINIQIKTQALRICLLIAVVDPVLHWETYYIVDFRPQIIFYFATSGLQTVDWTKPFNVCPDWHLCLLPVALYAVFKVYFSSGHI